MPDIQKWEDMTDEQKAKAKELARAEGARCAKSPCAGITGFDAYVLLDCSDYADGPEALQAAFVQGAQEILHKRT